MTNPGRPCSTWTLPRTGRAADGAGAETSADSFPAISPAQPWTRRARPTTRLPRPRLVIGAVPDQHRLRHRVVTVVGERDQHLAAAPRQGDRPAPAVERHGRRLPPLAAHLELAPVHAHAEPGAERL